MVEVCNDVLIKELYELKSKTCNTLKSKMSGCIDCKYNIEFENSETKECANLCLLTLTAVIMKQPDKRKIKGVY